MDSNNIYFSKIPNLLLYTDDNKTKSVLEKVKFNHKVISIFDYIYSCSGVGNGVSRFTLEDMIIKCGYSPNPNKGRSNDIFKDLLYELQSMGILKFENDLSTLKPKDLIKCNLNIDVSSRFAQISLDAKNKIYEVEDVDKSQLFAYYCYLCARMYKRSTSDGKIEQSGGRAEVCFPSFDLTYLDLKITDKVLIKYNQILTELNLIRYKNFGVSYVEGNNYKTTKNTPNFYTLFNGSEEEAKTNLEEGFKMYLLIYT